jgi:hypothetical protein
MEEHEEGMHVPILRPYVNYVELGKKPLTELGWRLSDLTETHETKYGFWRRNKHLRVRFPELHALDANTCKERTRQLRDFLILPDAFGPMPISFIVEEDGVTYSWDPEDDNEEDPYIGLNPEMGWYRTSRTGKQLSVLGLM